MTWKYGFKPNIPLFALFAFLCQLHPKNRRNSSVSLPFCIFCNMHVRLEFSFEFKIVCRNPSYAESRIISKILNFFLQGCYMTIHITPEPEFSYVSFESNIASGSYRDLVSRVIKLFQPGKFVVTIFVSKVNIHLFYRVLWKTKN